MGHALVDHCLELLAPLGAVRARRMFGGHGLYIDDLFVAIIAFDRLYLKADEATRERFAGAGCEPFVYDGKGKVVTLGYWTVPAEAMESPQLMQPWARLAMAAALRARAARASAAPRKPRAAAPKTRATPTRRKA
jgi:DNA transformation protein and related proteins